MLRRTSRIRKAGLKPYVYRFLSETPVFADLLARQRTFLRKFVER
jgi:hypothetical protein